MSDRDRYMPGVPCWIDTAQPDPQAASSFYGELFGWKLEDQMPPGSGGHYFMATLEGKLVAAIGSLPEGAPPRPSWNTYVWVDNADEAVALVRQAGGTVLLEPFDIFEAGRMATCADPSGAVFSVWQANGHRGAQLVNEPDTWTWNNLVTRDLEGSAAFYKAVFGWEKATFDLSEDGSAVLRLPGYGKFLELSDPDLVQRLNDFGAPEGFADAIAGMIPMPSNLPPDTPPHFMVSFSVDDADATAEAATKLGGKVLVQPFDRGPVRIAVLQDPQGATFAVGRFNPS